MVFCSSAEIWVDISSHNIKIMNILEVFIFANVGFLKTTWMFFLQIHRNKRNFVRFLTIARNISTRYSDRNFDCVIFLFKH